MKWATKHCANTILGGLILMAAPVRVSATRESGFKEIAPGRFALDLEKGAEAVFWTGDTPLELMSQPIPARDGGTNSFGMK